MTREQLLGETTVKPEPAAASRTVSPPSDFPAPLPARKSNAGLLIKWIAGALVLFICGMIAVGLCTQRLSLPVLSGLLATQTPRPSATPPGGLIEMVWAQHILVADQSIALEVIQRYRSGEDWGALCSEYSLDPGTKTTSGDLGWFSRGMMVLEFEEAAFNLEVGTVSEPIQTVYGWHILHVLGHEWRKP
jgi:hypothetical protein